MLLKKRHELPDDTDWLYRQPCAVIGYGSGEPKSTADVWVADRAEGEQLAKKITARPIASLTLLQVLRISEHLPLSLALDVESLAYSTLQGGEEFAAWLQARKQQPQRQSGEGDAILLNREGAVVTAVLNRAKSRNAIGVEMRDALVEALNLLVVDDSITQMRISGSGDCFSVGGELREFGLVPSPAVGHWVRSVQSPARLLAELSGRVSFYVHRTCIGSGVELPAFAAFVSAHPTTFFQLPELQMGLIPGAGGCVSIPRRIGRQRTAWLALTGKKIHARTALDWGLIDALEEQHTP